MSLKCDRCKDLKCRQAERNCKGFLDAAGKWIGGVVNAAGRATCVRNQGDMLGDMALSPTFSFSHHLSPLNNPTLLGSKSLISRQTIGISSRMRAHACSNSSGAHRANRVAPS